MKTPVLALVFLALQACQATESQRVVETRSVASAGKAYAGPLTDLAIGRFGNASPFQRGIFSDGVDRLGGQARTILKAHLSQSGRFRLADRENLEAMQQEAEFAGTTLELGAARYLISGQVTEFGRKTTGDRQLFGILGKGKQQIAYGKVTLNLIDARNSTVVHSLQGASEYKLSSREVLGFGSRSGYDSTLNGKVLDLAVTDAVNKLVQSIDSGEWSPAGAR